MKKLLSGLLVVVLVVLLCVMTVWADQETTDNTTKQVWSHLELVSGSTSKATGYCPHCCKTTDDVVEWTLYTRGGGHQTITEGGHYFLNKNSSATGAYRLSTEGIDVVLHLNGCTFERSTTVVNGVTQNNTGAIWPNAKNTTLTIVDDKEQKGAISGQNGGWVINNTTAGSKVVLYSGNLITNVTAIDAASLNTNGGAIYMTAGTFEMYGGTVKGTLALAGGAIYAKGSNTSVKIVGGTIYGGKTLGITNADGTIVGGGGAIYAEGSTVEIGGTAQILGGSSEIYGGNIYATKAAVNISGGVISCGTAEKRGGNIYMASTDATLTITGGSITDGICSGIGGGNIYANNGIFTMTGGTISGGEGEQGGNIYLSTGVADTSNYTEIKAATGSTVRIANGNATRGGNIYASGNLTLGACTFEGGTAEKGTGIYVPMKCNLTVDSTFDGETGIYYELYHLPETIYGGKLLETKRNSSDPINRNTGVFSGKLYLENLETKPLIYAKSNNRYMHIATVGLAGKDGTYQWFTSNAEAVSAYNTNSAYIIATSGSLALNGGEYVVDLNGKKVTITGTGKVTCFDSANADYATYGTATVSGPTLINEFKTSVADKDTYMVNNNGTYSFHYLDTEIVGVSVRTSAAGIYYTGVWKCDDLLKGKIRCFGVAVRLDEMPGEDFDSEEGTLYTEFAPDKFVSGQPNTGVVIKEIVKDSIAASQNNWRANAKVCAAAYITFQDGTTAVSKEEIAYSLYDTMEVLEDRLLADYVAVADELKAFHDTWKKAGVQWNFKFGVSNDIKQLNNVYADRVAYHGEFHDHSDSGGNSDGNYTLSQWKTGMYEEGMDFAAILDHRQVLHMQDSDWDNSMFIGGTEASTEITDYDDDADKMHYTMIFSNVSDFENVLKNFTAFNYKRRLVNYKYMYTFEYPALSVAQVQELIQLVKDNNGMFVHVHPKSSGYINYDDPMKYWFADWTGLEVFCGAEGYAPESEVTDLNYQLWVDLLAAGKRVWATAGSDQHAAPNATALTTIYSDAKNASNYVAYAKNGDLTCGPVGIRMCVGNTAMGGQTSFADGKRLVFAVSDFHESVYDPTHTYHVELLSDSVLVYSAEFDPSKPFYHAMEVDETAKFYRVEVFDDTTGNRIAIGNPIWNQD